MRSNQRRNRGLELGVMLLISEILRLGFDSIPPVTLITVIGQILLYVGVLDVPWDKYDVCISGHKVWNGKDWKSMILSTFEHGDDMHLYYNMVSFLVKGRSLELKHGTANFAFLLAFLCITTPALYVALAVLGAHALDDRNVMKSCAIGFSGVIFALKFITTVENHGYSQIAGFRVPVKYSAWVELVAIHMLVPNASFMGHLAGILAGFIYMKTPVGSLVDATIYSITGKPMRHYGGSNSRQNSSRSQSNENNYGSNFYNTNHRSNYGSNFYNRGNYDGNYDHRNNFDGYDDFGYPRNFYYDSRPTAPPGWRF